MAEKEKKDIYLDRDRETSPWEERRRALEKGFLETFSWACENSRAYQEIYRDHGVEPGDVKSLDDLSSLPVVRMSDLVERQKKDPPFGGFQTGSPDDVARVYINPGLIMQPGEREYSDTSWAEGLCGAGFTRGDLIMNTFNYHLWPYAFMLDDSARMIGAGVAPTGVGNTLMQVNIMRQLKINGFLGTPSFLNTLVQRAEGMGVDPGRDLYLEKAMVGAEMLPGHLRRRLEEKLSITIRQTYGTVFLGCIGYECLHNTGLHVPSNIVVEVVDPQTGREVAPGAIGEIVATNFSRIHPLIRFATGDLSLLSRETCPCGRTGPMLGRVLGRIDQATKVRGTFVHPWQTDGVMARFKEVFKYQVLVTRGEDENDQMTFIVELKDDQAESGVLKARMERDIKEFLTIKGEVRIAPRGSIPDFHKKIEDRRKWD